MMEEQWSRWQVAQDISGKVIINSVLLTQNDFIIKMSSIDGIKKIELSFDWCVDAYRYLDENFREALLSDLKERYGQNFYNDWSFFKVKNSEYLAWISSLSYHHDDFEHFCIIGDNKIFEIVSREEPFVRVIG